LRATPVVMNRPRNPRLRINKSLLSRFQIGAIISTDGSRLQAHGLLCLRRDDSVVVHFGSIDLCERHFRIAWSRSDATIRSMFLSCARRPANRHRRSRSGFLGAIAIIQWRKVWNGFYDPANDGMRNVNSISVSSILRPGLSWAVLGSMS